MWTAPSTVWVVSSLWATLKKKKKEKLHGGKDASSFTSTKWIWVCKNSACGGMSTQPWKLIFSINNNHLQSWVITTFHSVPQAVPDSKQLSQAHDLAKQSPLFALGFCLCLLALKQNILQMQVCSFAKKSQINHVKWLEKNYIWQPKEKWWGLSALLLTSPLPVLLACPSCCGGAGSDGSYNRSWHDGRKLFGAKRQRICIVENNFSDTNVF